MFSRFNSTSYFVFLFSAFALLNPYTGQAESEATPLRYVSDQLAIDLRSGPTNAYRFVGRLPSGTAVKIIEIDEENQTSHVELEDGKNGWVMSAWLMDNPGAAEQLKNVQNELTNFKQSVNDIQQQHSQDSLKLNQVTEHNNQLQGQVSELQNKLEIEQQKYLRLSDNKRFEPFYMGGAVAFIGIFIGIILGRPRKRSDGWS